MGEGKGEGESGRGCSRPLIIFSLKRDLIFKKAIIFCMYSAKGLLVCLILLGAAFAQTDFKNTCQTASLLPKLATGLIHLNPLDTYNNGANKDYYRDLSLAAFETIDVLGYGFSLTGFQTNCGNSFYTLIIDKVTFENQNKRMRIVVNFRNPADGTVTRWDLVSFTYIVVSRNFDGTYSNIWATVA